MMRVRLRRHRDNTLRRNGFRNWKRRQYEEKGLEDKDWSEKGCWTRMYGQGSQALLDTFPATEDAAITGSVAVALYDMQLNKRDITWHPNDLDIFIAIPEEERLQPLARAYPIMEKWVHDAEDKGFQYSLTHGSSLYSTGMCIYDFVCDNPHDHQLIRHPKVSFIVKCAASVREVCDEFDLPICGPILLRNENGYKIDVTGNMEAMFLNHEMHCRYRMLNTRTMYRMIKYLERGFTIVQPKEAQPYNERFGREFPTVEYYRPRTQKPVPGWFVLKLLGRWPTEEEAKIFNIGLDL